MKSPRTTSLGCWGLVKPEIPVGMISPLSCGKGCQVLSCEGIEEMLEHAEDHAAFFNDSTNACTSKKEVSKNTFSVLLLAMILAAYQDTGLQPPQGNNSHEISALATTQSIRPWY